MQDSKSLDGIEDQRGPLASGGTKRMQTVDILRWLSMLVLTGIVYQLVAAEPSSDPGRADQVIKKIELTDPVDSEKPKRKHDLVVYRDRRGFPEGYAMTLVNKVCLDDLCKVVEVKMYWDATGAYERLEYPRGRPLTKLKHKPFTAGDYERLDDILKDKRSILNRHSLGYLAKAGAKKESLLGVDGISGATPATVRQAVVKDAAWTTWVLWKYANTEIVPILHETTESHCTPAYIRHMLGSKDWRRIEFVLKYLLKQDTVSSDYTMQVAQAMPTADNDQFELALRFLERAIVDKNQFYRQLIKTLPSLKESHAAIVIDRAAADKTLDNEILVHLTGQLDQLTYYPIHLSLRLIERRKCFSRAVEQNVARLLDAKDFFVARRASAFLAKQKLSTKTEQKLKSFRDQYADRL